MKTVVVGVTGGIAAYKAIEVVHQLSKNGHNVEVIMTESAQKFITPLTFQTLSHNTVVTDMFDSISQWDTKHIELAQKANLFAILPATANIIGKIANGIADDMLSTTIMATKSPVHIFPAMNTAMYQNPIVQSNLVKLSQYGYHIAKTENGLLACGDQGEGKLMAWEKIVAQIETALQG